MINIELKRFFRKIITNSLNTQQVNYLGERLDPRFNLNRAAGFSPSMPVPRQNASQILLQYFTDDEDIVRLFAYMLMHEGERFYNRDLTIWGKDEFISLLKKHKWIYDSSLKMFFLDPFYEGDINFLKKIRVLDLRSTVKVQEIIDEITAVTQKMSIADLEWRVVIRLYDLDRKSVSCSEK